jgi:hypothetical protein
VSEKPTRHGLIPSAESRAMAELNDERRFRTANWEEPVRNAHSYGQVLVAPLADHLASLAAAAQHSVIGPSFAHLALLRAIMETSTLASWLLEPAIGVERRIKRSLTYRIDNADNLTRLRSGAARTSAKAARKRAREVVDALGWSFIDGAVAGERLPHAKRDFSRYAFAPAAGDNFDDVLWNYASAMGHGTFYAVAQPLREPPDHVPDPLDPRGSVRAVVTSAEQVATYAAVGYLRSRAPRTHVAS